MVVVVVIVFDVVIVVVVAVIVTIFCDGNVPVTVKRLSASPTAQDCNCGRTNLFLKQSIKSIPGLESLW